MTVYHGTDFTPVRTAAGYALFRAGVKVSGQACDMLAAALERCHAATGTPWRLAPPSQAVLVIAFLCTNLTFAELAAGFGISRTTCWRNITAASPRWRAGAGGFRFKTDPLLTSKTSATRSTMPTRSGSIERTSLG